MGRKHQQVKVVEVTRVQEDQVNESESVNTSEIHQQDSKVPESNQDTSNEVTKESTTEETSTEPEVEVSSGTPLHDCGREYTKVDESETTVTWRCEACNHTQILPH